MVLKAAGGRLRVLRNGAQPAFTDKESKGQSLAPPSDLLWYEAARREFFLPVGDTWKTDVRN